MQYLSPTDIESLRRAAAGGSADARAAWGKFLLSRRPPDLREGITNIILAANGGNPEAPYLIARHAAFGFGLPQNWGTALDFLQRAAERGHEPAQRDLKFLARGAEGDWKSMRARVDMPNWLASPPPKTVSTDPRIFIFEGFAEPEICDWMIAAARPRLERAKIYAGSGWRHDPGRSNSDSYFPVSNTDLIFQMIQGRIAGAVGLGLDSMEAPAVLHYTPGQEFLPHVDFLDPGSPGYAEQLSQLGQRAATFLIYLNDDYEGGETDFPIVSWRYKGRKGDALMFWNVGPDGTPDPNTKHAGLPPTSGEKWLLSQWLRIRPVAPMGIIRPSF